MRTSYLKPPVFPSDDDKTRAAYFVHIIAVTNVPILLLFIVIRTLTGSALFSVPNLILMSIATILTLAWLFMRFGWVRFAGYLHVSTIWIASTLIALNGSGARGTAFTSYFVVMLMAGLLLGWQPALAYTALSIVAAFGLAAAERAGLITPVPDTALALAIEGTVLFVFGGIFLFLIISSLQASVRTARASASELRTSNRELTQLRDDLELRVEDRTQQIEDQKRSAERRSRQFEGVSRVSRAISAAKNLQELLPEIAQVISEQFGFYHVGIFLTDAAHQYAILSAANSEGGQRMLARGHQLKIGEQGIVGYATANARPRIALNVGEDATFFNNPDLPLTQSEMALPLMSSGAVIGALDIQSTETNAFSTQDVEVLASLADQVSLAIQNARLFDQSARLLSESEALQRQYLRTQWSNVAREEGVSGFKYSVTGTVPIDGTESAAPADGERREVSVPILLRGEHIGTLAVQLGRDERMGADQMDLIKAVAERVALSAENARLFDETQKRATALQSLNEMGRVVSQQIELKGVLLAAYEQLRRVLQLDVYFVALYDEAKQMIRFPLVIDEDKQYTDESDSVLDPGSATDKALMSRRSVLQLLTESGFAERKRPTNPLRNPSKISASLMYVPLVVGQKAMGVLSIQSYTLNAYTADSVALAENIANQLAIAIQNAQLFENANRRAEHERIIADISAKIGASVRTENILRTAASELNQLLDGAEVLIRLGPKNAMQ